MKKICDRSSLDLRKLLVPLFRKANEANNFTLKDGTALKYDQLDTSVEKVRKSYTNLKTEWWRISERSKNGSGLAPEYELRWYQHIN